MKKKIVWLVVSCLMVAALVLASCAPAAPPEEEKPAPPTTEKPSTPTEEKPAVEKPAAPEEKVEMVKVKLTKLDGTVVEKSIEKPKYGGVLNFRLSVPPLSFDEVFGLIWSARTMPLTFDALMTADWARGPAGTGEASWRYYLFPPPYLCAGGVATGWELQDENTLVFHIRKGVYFHDKPPVNGRELTADDVVFSLIRLWTHPRCYHGTGYPADRHFVYKESLSEAIYAPDKWTVVLKCMPGKAGYVYEMASQVSEMVPHEAIEKWGDLNAWERECGTGPFILTDYVDGSMATLKRNPNYWMKDPLIPENQLPYVDMVKMLIIEDQSTAQAALRTGKIDHVGGYSNGPLSWEDAKTMKQTNPDLKYVRNLVQPATLSPRVDMEPFNDVRLRRALMMAIDQKEIGDTYYGGEYELIGAPSSPIPELMDTVTPFEELPQSVQEQFEYHPDKAKQLLAEAGYPNGLKGEIICYQASADLASLLKFYLAKVGVDLEISPKEYAVYSSIWGRKTHTANQLILASWSGTFIPFKQLQTTTGNYWNYSCVSDAKADKYWEDIANVYFDEQARRALMKEANVYYLEQAWYILLPATYTYDFWQPWLKGYSGEFEMGYNQGWAVYPKYVWLDLDLKEKLTGSR